MLTIYELSVELSGIMQMLEEWAVEHEGDITEFPLEAELEKLQGDLETKGLNIATAIVNLRAEAGAYKDQINKLTLAQRAIANKADRLETWLATLIQPGTKLKNERVSIGWRKSEQVVISCDPATLPEEFLRFAEPEPKKTELKKAIQEGRDVPGVRIDTRQNIQIK